MLQRRDGGRGHRIRAPSASTMSGHHRGQSFGRPGQKRAAKMASCITTRRGGSFWKRSCSRELSAPRRGVFRAGGRRRIGGCYSRTISGGRRMEKKPYREWLERRALNCCFRMGGGKRLLSAGEIGFPRIHAAERVSERKCSRNRMVNDAAFCAISEAVTSACSIMGSRI